MANLWLIAKSTTARLEGNLSCRRPEVPGIQLHLPMIHLPCDPCILSTASGEAGSGFPSLASACDVESPPDRARLAPNPSLEVSLTATREPPEILVSYGPILFHCCAIDAPFRGVRRGLLNYERQVLLISSSCCPLCSLAYCVSLNRRSRCSSR